MKRETGFVGRKERTLLHTWKLVVDQYDHISFPYGLGFGCGLSMKISVGEKISLQTQYKFSAKLGGKLTAPGAEISSEIGGEASETLLHEYTANFETSYTSGRCEFCYPRIHYSNARITVWEKHPLHVPLFVSRQTQFEPGDKCDIRTHCRHDPGKCGKECAETPAHAGRGSVLTDFVTGLTTRVERVIFAGRKPANFSLRDLLDDIVTTPDDNAVPDQIYLPELRGRFRLVGGPVGRYCLYSMDDVDRALGAVRLFRDLNRLYFLTKEPAECPPPQSPSHVELYDEHNEDTVNGTTLQHARRDRFHLIETDLPCQSVRSEPDRPLKLRLRSGDTTDEWPAVLFDQSY